MISCIVSIVEMSSSSSVYYDDFFVTRCEVMPWHEPIFNEFCSCRATPWRGIHNITRPDNCLPMQPGIILL